MRTIIIGVGNPVRRDDGVGLLVAQELRARLAGRNSVNVVELCAGGLRLMEAMAGYDRAIVIDAIENGGPPGAVCRLEAGGLQETRNASSTHDGSLPAALALGRTAGMRLPDEICFWAVEAGDVEAFGESLTPGVEAAAGEVVEAILRELGGA
jgi:hydrogenase maturation protease